MNFEYDLSLTDKDREIIYFQVYRIDKILTEVQWIKPSFFFQN